ncbi:MAG TPA: YIP1 family protein [Candidatus Hypogeohydataceae bacterium YC41]
MSEERPRLWEDILSSGKDIIFRPQVFFQAMPTTEGYLQPLLFASTIFLIVLAYNVLLIVTGLPFPNGQEMKDKALGNVMLKAGILYLLWILGLFLGAAVLHLSFKLLKGKAQFQGTFRLLAYSTMANFLSLVPLLGQYLSSVYALVLIMLGGRYVHGLSTPRAIAAPLLPALLSWAIVLTLIYAGILPLEKLKEGLRH